MRWVVGDIQGCALEFTDLLEAIAFSPTRDELWAAGDLINRGPDSLATLRLWRDIGGRGVLGNHDIYALRVAAGTQKRRPDTLESLLTAPDRDELLACIRALPVLARLPSPGGTPDAWLVHAGVHPKWTDLALKAAALHATPHDDEWLTRDDITFATNVRCCDPKGKRSPTKGGTDACVAPFFPWDTYYRGKARVVHGHWAQRGFYRGSRTLGLDSGCVWGGPLTAWCQDDDRIVSVPNRGRPR